MLQNVTTEFLPGKKSQTMSEQKTITQSLTSLFNKTVRFFLYPYRFYKDAANIYKRCHGTIPKGHLSMVWGVNAALGFGAAALAVLAIGDIITAASVDYMVSAYAMPKLWAQYIEKTMKPHIRDGELEIMPDTYDKEISIETGANDNDQSETKTPAEIKTEVGIKAPATDKTLKSATPG